MFYNIWMIFGVGNNFKQKPPKLLIVLDENNFTKNPPNFWTCSSLFFGGSFCFVLVASRTSIHSDGWFVRWTVWRLEAALLLAVQTMGKRWELNPAQVVQPGCSKQHVDRGSSLKHCIQQITGTYCRRGVFLGWNARTVSLGSSLNLWIFLVLSSKIGIV